MAKQWRVPPKYEARANKNASKQADALRAQADHTEKTPITSQVRSDLGKGLVAYKVGKFVHGRAKQAGMMSNKTKNVKWSTVDSSAKQAQNTGGTKTMKKVKSTVNQFKANRNAKLGYTKGARSQARKAKRARGVADVKHAAKNVKPFAKGQAKRAGASAKKTAKNASYSAGNATYAARGKIRKAKVAAKVEAGPNSPHMGVRKSYGAAKAWGSTAKTAGKYTKSRAGATKTGQTAKAWGKTAKAAGKLGKSYGSANKGKIGAGVAAGAVVAGGAGYAYKRRKAKKAATASTTPKRGRRR